MHNFNKIVHVQPAIFTAEHRATLPCVKLNADFVVCRLKWASGKFKLHSHKSNALKTTDIL